MSTEELIPMELYCRHEELDITFVRALTERGLIEVVIREERSYLSPEQITRLESLARMHFDLDINLEGIEAISHLLERVDRMQEAMRAMEQRLRLYEE
ncbi:MAG TPA: chaperone modulator CbpM [Flavobacteriales bacterium]|nr:chaperone modulator CbpM [Flavobacteriales bacterium]HNU57550.1 chaperone modulator CbpM [Flavobacteriales bacterium]